MFELSNKIDRLGSGQRQQQYAPSQNYGGPGQNNYRQNNHSLGPPQRSLQTINNDGGGLYQRPPGGGIASQNLLLNKDNRIGGGGNAASIGKYPSLQNYPSPGGLSASGRSNAKLRQHQDSSQMQY